MAQKNRKKKKFFDLTTKIFKFHHNKINIMNFVCNFFMMLCECLEGHEVTGKRRLFFMVDAVFC